MGTLTGRVAVITGAAGGIGAAIATGFAAEGAKVACLDLTAPEALAATIRAAGGEALALPTDVSNEAETLAAVARVLDAWQGVAILVNGAAPYDPMAACSNCRPPTGTASSPSTSPAPTT